jgi:hypothetical protein
VDDVSFCESAAFSRSSDIVGQGEVLGVEEVTSGRGEGIGAEVGGGGWGGRRRRRRGRRRGGCCCCCCCWCWGRGGGRRHFDLACLIGFNEFLVGCLVFHGDGDGVPDLDFTPLGVFEDLG